MTTPRDAATKVSPQRRITHEALAESFAAAAVIQILIAQIAAYTEDQTPTYQIEARVKGRTGMRTLTGTRNRPRQFKSLDTAARELRVVAGTSAVVIVARLELMAVNMNQSAAP